jgi:hypothetical protein
MLAAKRKTAQTAQTTRILIREINHVPNNHLPLPATVEVLSDQHQYICFQKKSQYMPSVKIMVKAQNIQKNKHRNAGISVKKGVEW